MSSQKKVEQKLREDKIIKIDLGMLDDLLDSIKVGPRRSLRERLHMAKVIKPYPTVSSHLGRVQTRWSGGSIVRLLKN